MGKPYSAPLSESAITEANHAPALAQSSGAAIVARVSLGRDYCEQGKIQLHQIVDGRVIEDSGVIIGQTVENESLISQLKMLVDSDTYLRLLNPEHIAKAWSGNYQAYGSDIRVSFRAIKPGKYYITSVYCKIGDKNVTVGSAASGFLSPGPTVPTLGDNFIFIKDGQIVDAGFVNIVTLEKQFFTKGKAFLSGVEAPESFRNILRNTLPGLAARITYARFSATPFP